jgi:hypothetical protein
MGLSPPQNPLLLKKDAEATNEKERYLGEAKFNSINIGGHS